MKLIIALATLASVNGGLSIVLAIRARRLSAQAKGLQRRAAALIAVTRPPETYAEFWLRLTGAQPIKPSDVNEIVDDFAKRAGAPPKMIRSVADRKRPDEPGGTLVPTR